MAVIAAVHGGYLPYRFRRVTAGEKIKRRGGLQPPPPVFISMNPAHLNLQDLKDLYALCNHSCHRFPYVDAAGRVEPVDLLKLKIAIAHSTVVVSAFTKPEFVGNQSSSSPEVSIFRGIGGEWIRKTARITPENGQLVGFGRAVSDVALTASIYDVMVHPALQGRGIGRMIVQRIVRMLTTKDIYDIAALCTDKERLFFKSCGFGDDMLGSTTMMYKQAPSGNSEDEKMISAAEGMGKIWIEVCLVSARGLRRTSSLWKLQWFAVGWIDPDDKYCTKIDVSGNGNPVWKTKFAIAVDLSESKFQELALQVEVYSREPIFLRESLLGTSTIVLKEFLDKYNKKSEVSKPVEETGSFQLRKKNSNKPQGFIDISIRISEEREEQDSSFPGSEEGFNISGPTGGINQPIAFGSVQPPRPPYHQLQSTHPVPISPSYPHHYSIAGPSYRASSAPQPTPPPYDAGYQPPRTSTPPPPPPPSNVGYVPNFFPRTDNFAPNYVNMPSSVAPPRPQVGPGFGLGVGAGAMAAGAVIFGDDFMSGFDFPSGFGDASLTISLDPAF